MLDARCWMLARTRIRSSFQYPVSGIQYPPIHAPMPLLALKHDARRSRRAAAGPTAEGAGPAKHAPRPGRARWLRAAREAGLFLALVGAVAVLCARAYGFTTASNVTKLLVDVALVAIAGTGLTLVVVRGGVDVSVGSMLALAAACSMLAVRGGAPAVAGLAIAVGVGLALGALNGAVTAFTRVPSVVVTLGALVLYRWLFLAVLGGEPIDGVPAGVRALAAAEVLGVQAIVWIAIAVVAAAATFLRWTAVGRRLRGVGDCPRALSVLAFAVCGATVGLAAFLWAGEYNAVETSLGRGFELQVIAAVLLGGASLRGGTGSVLGTARGALLVGVLYNGMELLDVPGAWRAAVFGSLLVIALLVNEWLRWLTRRREG